MGREAGGEGDYKVTGYVAAEFRRLGLEPAGDTGSFFQAVPLGRMSPDVRSTLAAASQRLVLGKDFVPSTYVAMPRTLSGVQVIYGGNTSDTLRQISAVQAQGKLVVLDVPNYDFNWQTYYVFSTPLVIPTGAKLKSMAWYDNSASNKNNPDATKDVKWGDQTWEEMQYTGILYSVPSRKLTKPGHDN